MANCLVIAILWSIVAILILAVVEQVLAWAWPTIPPPITLLMRVLVAILVLLWIVGCLLGGFPAPPALPGGR